MRRRINAISAVLLCCALCARAEEFVTSGNTSESHAGDSVVQVKKVELSTRTSMTRPGENIVTFDVTLSGPSKKPDGMRTIGRVLSAKTPDGKILKGDLPFGVFSIMRPETHFSLSVPVDVEKLMDVTFALPVFYSTDRQTLTWDIDKLRGETKKYGGFEFTPATVDRTPFTMDIATHMLIPNEGEYGAFSWVKFTLWDKAGTELKMQSGGGGGMRGGKYQSSGTFLLEGHQPATYKASFIAAARVDELTFTIKEIILPKTKTFRDASIPKGPRGSLETTTDGWRFKIRSIALEHSKEPYMKIMIDSESEQKAPTLEYSWNLKPKKAVDDLGKTYADMHVNPNYFWGGTDGAVKQPLTSEFLLQFPGEKADRLTQLSGALKVYLEEESKTVEIALPANKKEVLAPLTMGPLTVKSVRYNGDMMTVSFAMDQGNLPDTPTKMLLCAKKVVDESGAELKAVGGMGGNRPAERSMPVEAIATFKLTGKNPAKIVVRYPTKLIVKEIPFEFKDVGLPRFEGKWDVETMTF